MTEINKISVGQNSNNLRKINKQNPAFKCKGSTVGTKQAVLNAIPDEFARMKKMVVINGSPRKDSISNTYRALQAEIKYFLEKNPNLKIEYFKLPANMNGCIDCGHCKPGCVQEGDNFREIVKSMEDSTDVLLGSPVYLDMPTPQTVAFLTRLNCMAENTNRAFFNNKFIHLVSTAFCSGTKTCIHTMMGACEMLGFSIGGRSTREYIYKWNDTKLRGGMTREDAIFLDQK